MIEYVTSFPVWFGMAIVLIVVLAFVYRFVKDGVKIKVGPVEIDASEDEKTAPAPTEEVKK